MGAAVEVFDQAALHNKADGDHDRDGEQDRQGYGPVDHPGTSRFPEPLLDIENIVELWITQKVGSRRFGRLVAEC